MDSDRTDEVVELPGTVVGEPSEETVDSERTDVVVELPESVVGVGSEETVGLD